MGVAEIAPSTAENAPNYFPTGYTVTPLILTFNLFFHVGMIKNVYTSIWDTQNLP